MLTALRAFIVFCRYYESAAFPLLLLTGLSPDTCCTSHALLCENRPTLNLRLYPVAQHLMAPLFKYITSFPLQTFTSPSNLEDFIKVTFLISAVVIAVISYIALSMRRRRRRRTTTMDLEHSQKEKEPIPRIAHKRFDSTLSQPEDPNRRLLAIQEELSQHSLTPIYPWTAPPTPLPGPYDAPYYPLPLPSIRAFMNDVPATTVEPLIKSEDVASDSEEIPEETYITPYTRQLSPDTAPDQNPPIIRGTTTTSNHGWRRTQWTVSKA
jgi:hypothetical protein